MTRGSRDVTGELVDLWARLERLKVGIGGWIITGAAMTPEEARAENVDGRVRDLIDTALEVQARIDELSTPPARHSRPAPAAAVELDATGSPLSPVTGVPVIDLPDLIVEPGSEVWAALEQQTRARILRQREHPAHRGEQRSA